MGGFFGVRLRACGIRSLIIRGRSPHPVYLNVTTDGIEILDAGKLWGLDTRATENRLMAGQAGSFVLDVVWLFSGLVFWIS